jgi:hypothetical protein
MAETELYVTKVRTKDGDKKIDYNALANLPKFDEDWKTAHGIVDLSYVQEELDKKANSSTVTAQLGQKANTTKLLEVQQEVEILSGKVTNLETTDYATQAELDSEHQYWVNYNTVYENMLGGVLQDVTDLKSKTVSVATTDTAGIVKPGDGLTVIDGTLHVDKHPLEDLSNLHICQDGMPDLSTIINGHWYLVKVTE